MLDNETTAQDDLRSRQYPWQSGTNDQRTGSVAQDCRCDVLIVGGGISGAMAAQHLAGRALDVVLIDRERPGFGSTAASTAMLQWEIDAPIAELTGLYGFEAAAAIYRRSFEAVEGLKAMVSDLRIPCSFRPRSTLYIASGDAGHSELHNEHSLRQRAGLPGEFLNHSDLLGHFGLDREAAIVSPGSADADPLCLTHGLLTAARRAGVRVLAGDAVDFQHGPGSVMVSLDGGRCIEARHVVLATGYAVPDVVETDRHSVVSSWALATVPQAAGTLWPDECLIWEASESYHYLRTCADGRIIIGGEDEPVTDADRRDGMIAEKTVALRAHLARLMPQADTGVSSQWAGFFGETDDGLPLIGQLPGSPRILAAYGYGGNGITFSFMASRILARLIEGQREDWYRHFAFDR